MTTFNLPDLGEGLREAEIIQWHVAQGDHVVADQPLVSVETEKAVVEIPSPSSARVARICAKIGDRIKVGAPLVEFEEGQRADTGTVVGDIAGAGLPSTVEGEAEAQGRRGSDIKANPAVRALARGLDIDLSTVRPTGPDGTVTSQDVREAAAALARSSPPDPLKGVRRAMALNMMRAGAEVVPATVSDDADIDAWPNDEDVTIRLIRAIVAGCRTAPMLNAWYDGQKMERRLHANVDLGVAVDTGDGLFVPILRNVDARDAVDLRRGLEAMKADVRARTVPLKELRGQTITLSNFGMFAGRYASLALVPPQVAIVGAGRIAPRVVAIDGKAAVHRILPLSLTFDHRAVTGGEAARFLAAMIADLEKGE